MMTWNWNLQKHLPSCSTPLLPNTLRLCKRPSSLPWSPENGKNPRTLSYCEGSGMSSISKSMYFLHAYCVPRLCRVPWIFTVFSTLPQGKGRLLCLLLGQRVCAQVPRRKKDPSMAQRSEARLWRGGELVRLSSRSVWDGRNSMGRCLDAEITLYYNQRWVWLSRGVIREKSTGLDHNRSTINQEILRKKEKKTLYD